MKSLILSAVLAFTSAAVAASKEESEASRRALNAEAKQFFTQRDANHDGLVTREEYTASPLGRRDPARAEERFRLQDVNGDGKLTLEEFSVHPSKREARRK